jgi:hypothetical protein
MLSLSFTPVHRTPTSSVVVEPEKPIDHAGNYSFVDRFGSPQDSSDSLTQKVTTVFIKPQPTQWEVLRLEK